MGRPEEFHRTSPSGDGNTGPLFTYLLSFCHADMQFSHGLICEADEAVALWPLAGPSGPVACPAKGLPTPRPATPHTRPAERADPKLLFTSEFEFEFPIEASP